MNVRGSRWDFVSDRSLRLGFDPPIRLSRLVTFRGRNKSMVQALPHFKLRSSVKNLIARQRKNMWLLVPTTGTVESFCGGHQPFSMH